MSNRKYVMCLDCGNVQVRTDIKDIINGNYIMLSKSQLSCKRCTSKKSIVTNNIKGLDKKIESKPKEKTALDHRVLCLLRK